jgi:hypothetical protein
MNSSRHQPKGTWPGLRAARSLARGAGYQAVSFIGRWDSSLHQRAPGMPHCYRAATRNSTRRTGMRANERRTGDAQDANARTWATRDRRIGWMRVRSIYRDLSGGASGQRGEREAPRVWPRNRVWRRTQAWSARLATADGLGGWTGRSPSSAMLCVPETRHMGAGTFLFIAPRPSYTRWKRRLAAQLRHRRAMSRTFGSRHARDAHTLMSLPLSSSRATS